MKQNAGYQSKHDQGDPPRPNRRSVVGGLGQTDQDAEDAALHLKNNVSSAI